MGIQMVSKCTEDEAIYLRKVFEDTWVVSITCNESEGIIVAFNNGAKLILDNASYLVEED